VMHERGVRAGFLWINETNARLAALHKSMGWRGSCNLTPARGCAWESDLPIPGLEIGKGAMHRPAA
jgi:hypothetical protein